jgi:hypothetical protein
MLGGECQIAVERLTQQLTHIGNRSRCAVLDGCIVRIIMLGAKHCMDSASPVNGGERGNDRNRRQDPDHQHNLSHSHAD